MYTDTDRAIMADIINNAFKNSVFKPSRKVKLQDFNTDDTLPLIFWSNKRGQLNGANKILPILSELATNRKNDIGQFYHFKPSVDRVRQIISSKQIQLTALFYQSENDHAEFSEFLKQVGLLRMFCNNTLDDFKKRVFILCFTKNFREKRFWRDYASKDNGACIVFRIEFKKSPNQSLFDLRDVDYDTGSRFDFIDEIRYKLMKKFGKDLFLDGVTKFAQFYKRSRYSWENETRLSFNYDLHKALAKIFPIENTTDASGKITREFITLDLQNQFFDLVIDEIICGQNVTETQILDIQNDLNDPSIKVWKRPPHRYSLIR